MWDFVFQVTVWGDYGRIEGKKVFMGVAQIMLDDLNLSNLAIGWYKLFGTTSLVSGPPSLGLSRRSSIASLDSLKLWIMVSYFQCSQSIVDMLIHSSTTTITIIIIITDTNYFTSMSYFIPPSVFCLVLGLNTSVFSTFTQLVLVEQLATALFAALTLNTCLIVQLWMIVYCRTITFSGKGITAKFIWNNKEQFDWMQ